MNDEIEKAASLPQRLNAAYIDGMDNENWDDLDGVLALLLEAHDALSGLPSANAALEARVRELEEALKFCARLAEDEVETRGVCDKQYDVSAKDVLRRARSALQDKTNG